MDKLHIIIIICSRQKKFVRINKLGRRILEGDEKGMQNFSWKTLIIGSGLEGKIVLKWILNEWFVRVVPAFLCAIIRNLYFSAILINI
jgi:hypothetical protein